MNAEEPTNPIDAKKEALNRQSEEYKQAIADQVSDLKDNATRITKTALLVGAGLYVTYLIARAIFRSGNKNIKAYENRPILLAEHTGQPIANNQYPVAAPAPRTEPMLMGLIKQQIALFLVGLITQKLQEAISNNFRTNESEPVTDHETRDIEPIYIK